MTTPLTQKQDAATQQIAREAALKQQHSFQLAYGITPHLPDLEQDFLSAIERANTILLQRMISETGVNLDGGEQKNSQVKEGGNDDPPTVQPAAQPQPSKARKEQAPRAQGSPASGERSEPCQTCDGNTTTKNKPEQQEWTPEYVAGVSLYGDWRETLSKLHNAELAAHTKSLEQFYIAARMEDKQQLAAERQAKVKDGLGLSHLHEHDEKLLLPYQAAIEKLRHVLKSFQVNIIVSRVLLETQDVNLSALHEHDAEVREPLVKALFQCVDAMNTPELRHARCSQKYVNAHKNGRNALARAKEQ